MRRPLIDTTVFHASGIASAAVTGQSSQRAALKGPNFGDKAALKVGILCGGQTPERQGSLVSGETAAKALADAGYRTDLIDLAETDLASIRQRIEVISAN